MMPVSTTIGGHLPLDTNGAAASHAPLEPFTFDSAVHSVWGTLSDVWAGFTGQLPLMLAGLLVLVLTALGASLTRGVLTHFLSRSKLRRSLIELFQQVSYVSVWVLGLLLTAMIVFPGVTPTKALGGLGLLSVAVGFAFRDIFENFFAGVLLLWQFPFEPGDYIECEGTLGHVERVTIRMTTIRTVTDELVVVPNSLLFKNPVNVLTSRPRRRATLMVGVAYEVDVAAAVEVIKETLTKCETVSDDDPVQVFAHEFGDSSVNIEVAWWCASTPLGVRHSVAEVLPAIKKALEDNDMEIPFPYRTLVFKQPVEVNQAEVAATT